MLIGLPCFEDQLESKQPAQSGRTGRSIAGHPDGVGNDHRVGGELVGVLFHRRFEIRRADLFFELPQHADVDRNAGLARCAHAPQRSERRALVVGRPAAVIAVAVPGEGERIGIPRFRLSRGGLHIEMVVDGDGWTAAVLIKAAVNDRISRGLQDPRLASEFANGLCGQIGAAADVALPLRL